MKSQLVVLIAFIISINAYSSDALTSLLDKYKSTEKPVTEVQPAAPVKVLKSEQKVNSKSGTAIYALQVAAYKSELDAKSAVEELKRQNSEAFSMPVHVGGERWHRVYVGPFTKFTEATQFQSQNKDQNLVKESIIRKIYGFGNKALASNKPVPNAVSVEASREPASVTISNPMGQRANKTENETLKAEADDSDENQTLLGDWAGAKTWLSDHGVAVEMGYKGDYVSNTSGGIDEDSAYLGNFDLKMDFDLEKLVQAKGLSLSLYFLVDHGDDPTEFVGDSFATSNIESPNAFKLYEAYLSYNVDERFQAAVGVRDLNAIYNASDTAGAFINSAFGITPSFSQTGVNGPSIFPTAAMSANVKYESPTSFYFQTGMFNAQAGDPERPYETVVTTETNEGYLSVWELGFEGEEESRAYKYGLGSWAYTKPADRIDGAGQDKNWGFYLILDRSVCEKLSVFLKSSLAQETVNTFSASHELGFTYKGIIPSRNDDTLGLAVATAVASPDYKDASSSDSSETVYEFVYRIEVTGGMTVIPNYQLVQNPGLDPNLKDANVVGARFELVF